MERRATTMFLLLVLSCRSGSPHRPAGADAEPEGGAGGESTGGAPGKADAASVPEPEGTGGAPAADAAAEPDLATDTAPRDTAPRDTAPRDTARPDTAMPHDAASAPGAFRILV